MKPLPFTPKLSCQALILLAVGLLLCTGATTLAQPGDPSQREAIIDEPFRLQMGEEHPIDKRMLFDWGGWVRSSYWGVDDNVDRNFDGFDDGEHMLRRQELRLWGNLNIDRVHRFYARMRLDYLDWNSGTSYNGNDSDLDGPRLDRGWYDFRLSRDRGDICTEPNNVDLGVRVGRQYVIFGTGLVLSVPLDAVVADVYYDGWRLTGLAARSISSTNDFDRTACDDEEDRCFLGAELRYENHRDHEPFVYYLTQNDNHYGCFSDLCGTCRYGYDTTYYGFGSRGRFFHRDLQYTGEVVYGRGRSHAFSEDSYSREKVSVWAFDTELRWVPRYNKHHSQIALEYLLASGDGDRDFSPSNTIGGNRPGTDDHSFNAWGYRNTGLSFAPRISNLGMVRLHASTFPVNEHRQFKNLKVGTDLFFYHKQQSSGAASDTLSLKDHSYLGSAVDFFANWRITSDLAWMVRYGLFFPGDAFLDRDLRELFFTGLTINF